MILLEHQNIKAIFQKALFKNTVPWTCVSKGKNLL